MPYPQTNITAYDGIDIPTRDDPVNFDERSEDGWARLKPGGDQHNVLAGQVNVMATAANASAQAADTARLLAQAAAASTLAVPSASGTSATSLQLGFGAKSLVLGQTNKTFSVGQFVSIASAANPLDWMSGEITAFTQGTGAMSINVLNVGQATAGVFPTLASWIVSLTGAPAQTSQQQALSFVPVPMAALDMDLTQGEWFKKTINGNSTFTWSNVPQPPFGKGWVLELTITSGMVGFPASIRWAGGLTPTMLTGKTHQIVFSTTDGGTTVRAAVLAGYSA